jgi:hypothetical protein
VSYSLEIFDVRGDFPFHTGKRLAFDRPVKAKESFETFKHSSQVEADQCDFVVALNFEESITDLFALSSKGFEERVGESPKSTEHYKAAHDQRPPPSIDEQRQMRALYRRLKRLLPDRDFGGIESVEEMVISASAVNSNFSRCSNCNLPMHVESKEDHRCVRCQKENLCNFCLTSHTCKQ